MPIATDTLSLVFVGCFLFGLLFLLVAALLGSFGHGAGHDIGHSALHQIHIGGHDTTHVTQTVHTHGAIQGAKGASPAHSSHGNSLSLFTFLNPTAIVLFLLWFGFFGYVFHNITNLLLPLTLASAAASGLVIAALFLLLIQRVFGNSEGTTVQDIADRVGLLGKVSTTIQENDIGEITYVSPGGMRKSIPARSVDGTPIARDQEVVVLNYQRGIAEVDTWEHFVNQSHNEDSDISASDVEELAQLRALLEETTKDDSAYIMRKNLQKE
jgi:membrane protein implicated in regulation of membrane protease activity